VRDKKGNRLFKQIRIKVVFPPKTFPTRIQCLRAPEGKCFNDSGLSEVLDKVADKLDSDFPMWEFRLVQLPSIGNTIAFNFIYGQLNVEYVTKTQEAYNGPKPE
jgi:hypothetical protein